LASCGDHLHPPSVPTRRSSDLQEFRTQTQLLGKPWDPSISYGQYLHTLDVSDPKQLVIMHRAAALFRGADYQVIAGQPEEELIQDRKSTRLNSSHVKISYAAFC